MACLPGTWRSTVDNVTIDQLAQNKAALHLKLHNDEESLKVKHCGQEKPIYISSIQ